MLLYSTDVSKIYTRMELLAFKMVYSADYFSLKEHCSCDYNTYPYIKVSRPSGYISVQLWTYTEPQKKR